MGGEGVPSLVEVARATSDYDAEVIAARLRTEGVMAVIFRASSDSGEGPRVMVPEQHERRARAVIDRPPPAAD